MQVLLMFSFIVSMFFSPSAFAQKEHEILRAPVEGSGYTVFIDLNSNSKEREAVLRFTKETGRGLAIIPSLNATLEIEQIHRHYMNLSEALESLKEKCKKHLEVCAKVPALTVTVKNLEERANRIVEKHKFEALEELYALSKEFKAQNSQITHLVISGHHGDEEFGGDFYEVDKSLHEAHLFDLIKAYPSVYRNLTFLALWGCDSVTTETVDFLINGIPTLNVIGGFYDTAPNGSKRESYEYLQNLLFNESTLPLTRSREALLSEIEKIDGGMAMYSALFVRHPQLGLVFYNREDSVDTLHRGLVPYLGPLHDPVRCEQFMSFSYDTDIATVKKYYFGTKDIPKDLENSPLRDVYFDLAQHFYCYRQKNEWLPKQVGLLRFFEGVQENFIEAFSKEIKLAQLEINRLGLKTLTGDLSSVLGSMSRPKIIAFDRELQAKLKAMPGTDFMNTKAFSLLLHRYLVVVDPLCMDFLTWHEQEATATPLCTLKKSEYLEGDFEWKVKSTLARDVSF